MKLVLSFNDPQRANARRRPDRGGLSALGMRGNKDDTGPAERSGSDLHRGQGRKGGFANCYFLNAAMKSFSSIGLLLLMVPSMKSLADGVYFPFHTSRNICLLALKKQSAS